MQIMSLPSVLIIDDNASRAAIIQSGLFEAGHDRVSIVYDMQGIVARIAELEPDVIVIDLENPNRDRLEGVFQLSRVVKRPIAMFVDRSDKHMMETAIDAGVSASGLKRFAAFDGTALSGVIYLGTKPVAVSRNWAANQLEQSFANASERWHVVAGRPANDMPDKGAIICACMNVGLNEIIHAANEGCASVEAIGQCTKAGTNCGSCVSERRIILNGDQVIAAE